MRILLGVVSAGGAIGLFICSRLHSGYVDALSDSLRAGRIVLDETKTLDRTTELTLSMTAGELDRKQLLEAISKHRVATGEVPEPDDDESGTGDDTIAAAVADFRSRDEVALARLRDSRPLAPVLAGHVVPLLARPFASEAVAALEEIAPRIVGQLTDALLDPSHPSSVRRRIAVVLTTADESRATAALVAGLSDSDFAVRRQCGLALDSRQTDGLAVDLDDEVLFARIRDEAGRDDVSVRQRLAHVGTLLGLVLDRETVRLATRALISGDDVLRGTGLEYLENVVPTETYSTLRPLIRDAPRAVKSRPAKQVVGELLLSVDTDGLDVAAIREHIGAKNA